MHITVETPIPDTPRVLQVRGMFDLPADKISRLEWDVRLPLDEKLWHVGLIVGPSGSGKTTIARRLFPEMQPARNASDGDACRTRRLRSERAAACSMRFPRRCRSRSSSPS